ncbi:hypothetical protein FWD20_00425 [Candidatus Saccharibacteria bacterium]|nr:hypothetical protein [Candidatus Saccharibacteria bacterium]
MKVLFVCNNTVGRSQAAKAFYNQLTNSHDADAAGVGLRLPEADTMLKFFVAKNGEAAMYKTLQEIGIDIGDYPRVQLTPEMLGGGYDLIVNIADKSQTPKWLRGDKVIWWNVPDPGHKENFEERLVYSRVTRDLMRERVKKLIEIEKSGGDFHKLDDNIDGGKNDRK